MHTHSHSHTHTRTHIHTRTHSHSFKTALISAVLLESIEHITLLQGASPLPVLLLLCSLTTDLLFFSFISSRCFSPPLSPFNFSFSSPHCFPLVLIYSVLLFHLTLLLASQISHTSHLPAIYTGIHRKYAVCTDTSTDEHSHR